MKQLFIEAFRGVAQGLGWAIAIILVFEVAGLFGATEQAALFVRAFLLGITTL